MPFDRTLEQIPINPLSQPFETARQLESRSETAYIFAVSPIFLFAFKDFRPNIFTETVGHQKSQLYPCGGVCDSVPPSPSLYLLLLLLLKDSCLNVSLLVKAFGTKGSSRDSNLEMPSQELSYCLSRLSRKPRAAHIGAITRSSGVSRSDTSHNTLSHPKPSAARAEILDTQPPI